jgi:limonene-1,2-epoxide hydrolase
MNNSEIISRFCEAYQRMDADELIAYFHDDAVYHNIPMSPLVGRAAILQSLEALPAKFQAMRFETLRQVAAGDVVFNERIDYLQVGEREIVLPVAGVFELDGGRIRAWRDYFDLGPLKARPTTGG